MAVAAIVLMLSIAGVSALMSFTVSRRAREIAIRSAMGARRRQIVTFIFRRVSVPLLAGVALGSLIALPVLWGGLEGGDGPRSLVIVSALLLCSALAACLPPVRRALAIEPAVAMKSE
jgi:ABC-type antimicrobial peptide transport system permease subunit